MIFGPTPIDEALGAILAHSLKVNGSVLKKGLRLTKDNISVLREAGHASVVTARLDEDDVHEDEAAAIIAAAICGQGLRLTRAATGRCNLIAEQRGLICVDENIFHQANNIDASITIAMLKPFEKVEAGQIVATVKIIPFAVERDCLDRCLDTVGDAGGLLGIHPFSTRRIGLVQAVLPGQKQSLKTKMQQVTTVRLAALGNTLAEVIECDHEANSIAAAIENLSGCGCEIVLISGASATVDRLDAVPEGMVLAGGKVDHVGMPVDPGNLTVFGHRGDAILLGLPGCARSPKLNGFDWVLERLVAGIAVRPEDIMRMGLGGLLSEISERPLTRSLSDKQSSTASKIPPRIAALVMAAGQSTRMGPQNKLLADIEGTPMIRRVVSAALASKADPVLVVTGHERDQVEAELMDLDVSFVPNPDFAEGLSASLRRGLSALPEDIDGVIICLGDMPYVSESIIDSLITPFNPEQGLAICLPTRDGKRGNPVLFAQRYFLEMQAVSGDMGARTLIRKYSDFVHEVAILDDSVLVDIDDLQTLLSLQADD